MRSTRVFRKRVYSRTSAGELVHGTNRVRPVGADGSRAPDADEVRAPRAGGERAPGAEGRAVIAGFRTARAGLAAGFLAPGARRAEAAAGLRAGAFAMTGCGVTGVG